MNSKQYTRIREHQKARRRAKIWKRFEIRRKARAAEEARQRAIVDACFAPYESRYSWRNGHKLDTRYDNRR